MEIASLYYVFVRNGQIGVGFPAGPFATKDVADTYVDPTRRYIENHVDPMAGFFAWGVARVPADWRQPPMIGSFNEHIGYQVPDDLRTAGGQPR